MTDVRVYGTAWCEVTRNLRIFLGNHHVPYGFVNVENNPDDPVALETMKDGRYELPVVRVGERNIRNPSLSVLKRALEREDLLKS